MVWLLVLTGPATYLMRACGLLLARTRLVPRQMESALTLVSTAVLAALVAPSLLRPEGQLSVDPLENPRLLVALLVLPLILLLRRWVQTMLLLTLLAGMGLLWGLRWLPDLTISLSLPLALLLLASAGLLLLLGRHLARHRQHRSATSPGLGAMTPPAVTVTPMEQQLLSAEAMPLSSLKPIGGHFHCIWCWCPLPMWALYCGQCGLPQQTPAHAITQPLAAIMVKPEGSERSSRARGARAERTNSLPLARGGERHERVSLLTSPGEEAYAAGQGKKGGGQ